MTTAASSIMPIMPLEAVVLAVPVAVVGVAFGELDLADDHSARARLGLAGVIPAAVVTAFVIFPISGRGHLGRQEHRDALRW